LRERRRRLGGVEVILLCEERDCRDEERFFGAVRHSLAWFAEHIGPYPYPVLTVVVPPPFAGAAGGMEYPTLITALSPRWIPSFLRLPEMVTVHEFGHQYWYGMVASNEAEEAWLDEGINSYSEGKIMESAYGHGSGLLDLPSVHVGATAVRRGVLMLSGSRDPAMTASWAFLDQRSYAGATYDRTAVALDSLEGYVGEEKVLAGLRRYFDRWRFRHPAGADFLAAMNEAAGADLTWYFDQTLRSSALVDYAVTRVSRETVERFAGIGVEPMPAPPTDTYQSTVVLERLGDARLPVDVAVVFDDGSETLERWDGEARWRRFEYTGTHGVAHAVVDPGGKLPLDANPLNNSRMREPGTRGLVRLGLRWGFWFQNALHLLTSF
jgi:aminopeptidase N